VQGTAAVVPKGLIISLIVTGMLLITGWKGWNMVYRHRVGVADAPEFMRERDEVRIEGRRTQGGPRRAA